MSKKKVYRSGVIPYYVNDEGTIQMLFMKPSDPKFGGSSFQIAKGKREDGETDEEAGFREASEELGLFSGNITDLHKLGNFLGRTMIYVAKIKDPDMFGDPTTPEEVEDTRWMSSDEFQAEGRDLHKPVIKAAIRLIKQKENLE